jgi:hypothetical protein
LLESYGVGYKYYTEQYLDSTGIFKDAVISILAIVAKQERVLEKVALCHCFCHVKLPLIRRL